MRAMLRLSWLISVQTLYFITNPNNLMVHAPWCRVKRESPRYSQLLLYFIKVVCLHPITYIHVVCSFCRAMLCISAAYAVMRCLSVCLSVCLPVTLVSCVKTNNHIFQFFSPSGSQAILVFLYQTALQYSDGNPPNGGVECRCGRQKSRFWDNIWLHCQLSTLRPRLGVVNTPPLNRDKLWRYRW